MKHYFDLLPLYAAGQLPPEKTALVAEHLKECPLCMEELTMWQNVANEIRSANSGITAPPDLAKRAIAKIHTGYDGSDSVVKSLVLSKIRLSFLRTFNLLRAQAYLVKRELWPASASIMALGVIVALLSTHAEAISFIIPLIAAASLSVLYGPDQDQAHELVLATPTSSWKILLARLSIVSLYTLMLGLLASLGMLLIISPDLLGTMILSWLAPMAFLSTLALLLSLWMGTGRAIVISYGLWILQYLQFSKISSSFQYSATWDVFINNYREFWHSPGLMLILSCTLLVLALMSTRLTERGFRPISS
jgi:hypothetical protein